MKSNSINANLIIRPTVFTESVWHCSKWSCNSHRI